MPAYESQKASVPQSKLTVCSLQSFPCVRFAGIDTPGQAGRQADQQKDSGSGKNHPRHTQGEEGRRQAAARESVRAVVRENDRCRAFDV